MHTRRKRAALFSAAALSVALALSAARPASAQLFDYSNGFANTANLTANQNAAYGPIFTQNVLRLTNGGGGQAGSVFTNQKASVAAFSTSFTFRLYDGSNPMADGFTFCLQNVGPTALGPSGGGLGYGPDNTGGAGGIRESVALKFDLYSNEGEGTNTVGLFSNGEGPILPAADLTPDGVSLHSQDIMRVDLDYDGIALAFTITDTQTGNASSQFWTVDLPALIGSDYAYAGFTGGTGGLTATQDIRTWRFQGNAVPAPAALPLFAVALSGAVGLLCRRNRQPASC